MTRCPGGCHQHELREDGKTYAELDQDTRVPSYYYVSPIYGCGGVASCCCLDFP